jgi:phenylacetate-coenzyme A ligase PaaK-like adenylate-forming protein
MSDFISTFPGAVDTVRSTLTDLRSVPELVDRYRQIISFGSLGDLVHVPVMRKDDLNIALEHLQPKAETGATWTFQSGGSTGSPKLGYAPTGLYMAEVHEHWKPLGRGDVFVNGWGAGKLWGAHYLMGAYADLTGCTGIGLGAVNRSEYDVWLKFFVDRRVTSIGGTPSVLRPIIGRARELGVKLPDLRTVLWLGEAWSPGLDEDLPAVAPDARRWGLFGSTETWVVATNTPDCDDDCWHPLPSQLVHVGQDGLLDFTSLKPDGLNPVLRYQTGDAGEWTSCPCGAPGRALRVLGRRDGEINFRGLLLDADALVQQVAGHLAVAEAQLVLTEYPARGSCLEVLVVPARPSAASLAGTLPDDELAYQVRAHILGSAFGGPSTAFHRDPEALSVRVVPARIPNDRTGKVANLIQRRQS